MAEALNFRLWYKSVDRLLNDEDNDLFPPRFKLKAVNKDYSPSALNLVYKYTLCIKSKRRKDKHLMLNISGFGQHFLKGLLLLHAKICMYAYTGCMYVYVHVCGCVYVCVCIYRCMHR